MKPSMPVTKMKIAIIFVMSAMKTLQYSAVHAVKMQNIGFIRTESLLLTAKEACLSIAAALIILRGR